MSQEKNKDNENVVFVGSEKKQVGEGRWDFKVPLANYINAVRMVLDKFPEVIVKARGKAITRACDVVTNKSLDNAVEIKNVSLTREMFEDKKDVDPKSEGAKGRDVNVSAIEIVLKKK